MMGTKNGSEVERMIEYQNSGSWTSNSGDCILYCL